jgi:hypothetical protein
MTSKSRSVEGSLVPTNDLIERFESGAIEPGDFHHADHVRLAFEYLSRYTVLEALERFPAALKRFAAAHGKTQLYHETITWAYLLLIHERMVRGRMVCERMVGSGEREWEHFAEGNQDLLAWKDGVLERFYSKETLGSELARQIFVLPDRLSVG